MAIYSLEFIAASVFSKKVYIVDVLKTVLEKAKMMKNAAVLKNIEYMN